MEEAHNVMQTISQPAFNSIRYGCFYAFGDSQSSILRYALKKLT